MVDPISDLVRATHRERYLAALFASDDVRPELIALYAFDAEIARIPALVSEAQLGEIRLQWWRDSIDALYAGEVVEHPVAQALAQAITRGKLPREAFHNLIEARSRELYADQMPNLNDLEGYLGETRSAVIQMAAHVLLGGRAGSLSGAAGLAGVSQGIADVVSSATAKPQLLPMAMTVDQLIFHAQQRFNEFCEYAASIPREVRPAFLPLAPMRARLSNNLRPVSALRTQWQIWRCARSGRF